MNNTTMLTRYKAWANELVFSTVSNLPDGEVVKPRQTRFGNILHTLNHAYVIDAVFKAHLLGEAHGYTARNTESPSPLDALWQAQTKIDCWYVDYAKSLNDEAQSETVEFEFTGGGQGKMTRVEILLHIVNYGTYHRGFVSDLMYQIPASVPANDLPVFLRDVDFSAAP